MVSAHCLLLSLQMTFLHRRASPRARPAASISHICLIVFALYNRNPTFIAFLILLIMAEYTGSAILGYGFISDIVVINGLCETGHKAAFIRYLTRPLFH